MQVELSNSTRMVNITSIFCCIRELEGIFAPEPCKSSLYHCIFSICAADVSKTICSTLLRASC